MSTVGVCDDAPAARASTESIWGRRWATQISGTCLDVVGGIAAFHPRYLANVGLLHAHTEPIGGAIPNRDRDVRDALRNALTRDVVRCFTHR
jgi:hypothetical protein